MAQGVSVIKWFKHDSDAHTDAKLRRLRLKYGMQGYGLYWYCLELIARGVEKNRLTFELEHDAELIAVDTGISRDLVEDMMRYMSEIGLFEQSAGIITCLKMASRTDEYTAKLLADNARDRPASASDKRIYFIGHLESDTVKVGVSANPWSRCKEFQTGHPHELSVLATVRTPIQSEAHVADALQGKHKRGEWYVLDDEMRQIIKKINDMKAPTCSDLLAIIASVVGSYDRATADIRETKTVLLEQNRTEQTLKNPSQDRTLGENSRGEGGSPESHTDCTAIWGTA